MRYGIVVFLVSINVPPAAAQDVKVGDKTVKQWVAALKHSEPRVRYQAVAALHAEGADAAPLVKELTPLLKDSQPIIRRAVAMTLGNCKGDAAPAVPALVAAMKDSDYAVRYLASQALGEIGEPAAAPLIELLNDKDAVIRQYAVLTISGLGLQTKEVAKALGKAVKDASPAVRSAALFALSKIDTDDADIFALLGAALRDKEKQVRLSAVSLLVGKGKEASGTLVKAADDGKAEQRVLALQTLASLGDEIDDKGVLALRKALGDDEMRVRQTAALGLANLGKPARALGGDKELFEALTKLLKEKDAPLRRTAALALGQIGSDDADEIKTVAAALKDGDAMVRSFTVQALARYLKDTESEDNRKELQDHLLGALRDTDRRVQFMAAQTLAQQTLFVVEPLTKLVEDGKGTQRLWAATILGEIGVGALDAVPALTKMSRDGTPDARRIATLALQKIQAE
jgi:HEAT repeat protein